MKFSFPKFLSQFSGDGVDEEWAFADEAEVGACFFDEVTD